MLERADSTFIDLVAKVAACRPANRGCVIIMPTPSQTVSMNEIHPGLVKSLAETSDLSHAFDLMLQSAISLDGVDCGGVYLVSERSADLVSHIGLSEEFIQMVSHYENDHRNYGLVMEGEVRYGTYSDLVGHHDEIELEHLRAFALLPVRDGDRVVAALNLASRTVDDFPEKVRPPLENLVSQVGGIIRRIAVEEEFRQYQAESLHVLNALGDPMHSVDDGLIIRWINPAFEGWAKELGIECPSVGQTISQAFPFLPEEVFAEYHGVFREGKMLRTEEWTRVGSRRYLTETTKMPVSSSGRVSRVLTVVRDVTPKRRASEADTIVSSVLSTLSSPQARERAIRDILVLLKEHASVEAVAIRLRDGDGYPYYEVNGLPDGFIETDGGLCGVDDGVHPFGCFCGAVIERRNDLSESNFTQYGSFYTGNMTELMSRVSGQDGQRVGKSCTSFGYESVLLIPLKFNGTMLGLLQFNDHRRDLFDMVDIRFLESVSRSIAIAVQRKMVSDDLAESEKRYRLLAAELEASNSELMEYSHVVSHQLRSPMRSIKQLCDMMKDEAEKSAKDCIPLAEMASRKASECTQLIEDILSYSEVGKTEVVVCPVKLGPLIRSVFDDVSLSWSVSVKMPDDWPLVTGEPVLVKQIFQNLVENAVKFNESSPKVVEIGWIDAEDDCVDIYVRDNGIGIPEEWRQRMWRPHEKYGYYEGTGMGLAIVQRAAQKLDIPISVQSEVGKGSTFTLRFKRV